MITPHVGTLLKDGLENPGVIVAEYQLKVLKLIRIGCLEGLVFRRAPGLKLRFRGSSAAGVHKSDGG